MKTMNLLLKNNEFTIENHGFTTILLSKTMIFSLNNVISSTKTYLKSLKINLFECSKKLSTGLSCVFKTRCVATGGWGGVEHNYTSHRRRNDIAMKGR